MANQPSGGDAKRISWRKVLDRVVTVLTTAASIAILWTVFRPYVVRQRARVSVPSAPISLAHAPFEGESKAAVAVIAFSDFECPYCGRFARETLPALRAKYIATGQIRFAFRNLPLTAIHKSAERAAEAAECASRQDEFWPLHDRLFERQEDLAEASLFQAAAGVGLDLDDFKSCMNGEAKPYVAADITLAKSLGITGTPTFLIGRVQPDGQLKVQSVMSGARPLEEFTAKIDQALKAAARPPA